MASEIAIRTDKGEYVGGDMIYGAVYLCVDEYIPSRSLRLQLRGTEICEYDYMYVEQEGVEDEEEEEEGGEGEVAEGDMVSKTGTRTHRAEVIKADMTLIDIPGGFSPGYFVYPFKYQLPHNLPGVFHAKHEDMGNRRWEGVIKYTIGAVLDTPVSPGNPERKMHVESPLVIYDCLECRNRHMAPDPKQASGRVKTFFCINRGTVNVSSKLDFSAYTSKEIITVHLEVRNNSAVDVALLTVKLVRVIKLHGIDRTRGEVEPISYTHYDTVVEVEQPGCAKNTTRKLEVDLDLTQLTEDGVGIPPTTSGSIVKASYVVDVDVHVPWAPDIDLRQPLVIRPLANTIWENWNPPLWVTKCVEAPVIGSCAVPPEDIFSASFAGIPGFQPNI